MEEYIKIKYYSESRGESVDIEEMHPQHLSNAIHKAVRGDKSIVFEIHKTTVEEVVWHRLNN
jgi:NAD-dependent dihydropyrimidine dehydrogenase PreA subunit|tara:strand:- start:668 stop:853 length:186 start_codon:yes stop_codon:yes gene_type:complete